MGTFPYQTANCNRQSPTRDSNNHTATLGDFLFQRQHHTPPCKIPSTHLPTQHMNSQHDRQCVPTERTTMELPNSCSPLVKTKEGRRLLLLLLLQHPLMQDVLQLSLSASERRPQHMLRSGDTECVQGLLPLYILSVQNPAQASAAAAAAAALNPQSPHRRTCGKPADTTSSTACHTSCVQRIHRQRPQQPASPRIYCSFQTAEQAPLLLLLLQH